MKKLEHVSGYTVAAVATIIAALLAVAFLLVSVGNKGGEDKTPSQVETVQAEAPFDRNVAFLTFLNAKDVGTTSDEAAVAMGHKVIEQIRDEGVHPFMVGTRIVSLGYTGDEAATIVGASIAIYGQEFVHYYE